MACCTGRRSHSSWETSDYDTDELLGKVFYFFECQESGKLHTSHRVAWRGDSYLTDGASANLDLVGGWFDAGGALMTDLPKDLLHADHLKLVFPMSWTVTQIAWAMFSGEGMLKASLFDGKSNWHWALRTLLHGLDFLAKCHVKPDTFVVQVGDAEADHKLCLRAELDTSTPRPVYTVSPDSPGADAMAMASAAFAASAAALRSVPSEAERERKCILHAKVLYKYAQKHPGCYSVSVPECAKTYPSDNWQQYMFLAAAWLFVSTGDQSYQQAAEEWQDKAGDKQWWSDYSWQNVYFGACALMWTHTKDHRYGEKLHYFAKSHLQRQNGIKRTPCGLTFVSKWGSTRHAAGAVAILACYSRGLPPGRSQPVAEATMGFARSQVCYLLGASGHSWVVDYGVNPPKRPHHRDAALRMTQSGDWEAFNGSGASPNILTGALVGGPKEDGTWADKRTDYMGNEVALDYNAALLIAIVQCLASE